MVSCSSTEGLNTWHWHWVKPTRLEVLGKGMCRCIFFGDHHDLECILAWRSEDSVESAKSSQSEVQPGSSSSAIQSEGGSKKSDSVRRYMKLRKRAGIEEIGFASMVQFNGLWADKNLVLANCNSVHCYRFATAIDCVLIMTLSFELSKLLWRIWRIFVSREKSCYFIVEKKNCSVHRLWLASRMVLTHSIAQTD